MVRCSSVDGKVIGLIKVNESLIKWVDHRVLCLLIGYLLYLIADPLQCLMPGKKTQRREHNSFIPNKRAREQSCEALYIERALSIWSTSTELRVSVDFGHSVVAFRNLTFLIQMDHDQLAIDVHKLSKTRDDSGKRVRSQVWLTKSWGIRETTLIENSRTLSALPSNRVHWEHTVWSSNQLTGFNRSHNCVVEIVRVKQTFTVADCCHRNVGNGCLLLLWIAFPCRDDRLSMATVTMIIQCDRHKSHHVATDWLAPRVTTSQTEIPVILCDHCDSDILSNFELIAVLISSPWTKGALHSDENSADVVLQAIDRRYFDKVLTHGIPCTTGRLQPTGGGEAAVHCLLVEIHAAKFEQHAVWCGGRETFKNDGIPDFTTSYIIPVFKLPWKVGIFREFCFNRTFGEILYARHKFEWIYAFFRVLDNGMLGRETKISQTVGYRVRYQCVEMSVARVRLLEFDEVATDLLSELGTQVEKCPSPVKRTSSIPRPTPLRIDDVCSTEDETFAS
ncbi:hypothetical protein CLF_112728 [Clonorchis sinensis]|uniref:Uncharacterized protein n=1 Tax=Clonorchis sinensis TaxID=79923 RepID=G7YWW0_CLOSI|nr:hypothetical protein CLF_112728 [Clonorchis sinensis]